MKLSEMLRAPEMEKLSPFNALSPAAMTGEQWPSCRWLSLKKQGRFCALVVEPVIQAWIKRLQSQVHHPVQISASAFTAI
ncbi:hypothetical protein [Shewanella sp. GXUN23E]|uniref:hypothetical protein n=1 Tax=Shewanella sp. GXUN23E TaxID=3422498 RepID=UPI003D7CB6E9